MWLETALTCQVIAAALRGAAVARVIDDQPRENETLQPRFKKRNYLAAIAHG